MQQAINAFLLGFPALFSIVNPISGALIFRGVAASRPDEEHARLAKRVALYSLLVMMVALWAGSYVLAFFGISLAALRVAGGTVIALSAWGLLTKPEQYEAVKEQQASTHKDVDDIALFPLTIPFTTGPGTISVAVTLSASRPKDLHELGGFFLGMTAAVLAMALVIWALFGSADRLSRLMGPTGSRTVTRISAAMHRGADPDLGCAGCPRPNAERALTLLPQDLPQERPRPLRPRVREELVGRRFFHDLACVHEDHAVRHAAREAHLVGHAEHGHIQFCQTDHGLQHLFHHLRVECRGRFVKQHDLGLHAERARDRHPLLLPAG
jgi:multiple antibiotic resistance protein